MVGCCNRLHFLHSVLDSYVWKTLGACFVVKKVGLEQQNTFKWINKQKKKSSVFLFLRKCTIYIDCGPVLAIYFHGIYSLRMKASTCGFTGLMVQHYLLQVGTEWDPGPNKSWICVGLPAGGEKTGLMSSDTASYLKYCNETHLAVPRVCYLRSAYLVLAPHI